MHEKLKSLLPWYARYHLIQNVSTINAALLLAFIIAFGSFINAKYPDLTNQLAALITSQEQVSGHKYVAGQALVKFKAGVAKADKDRDLFGQGASVKKSITQIGVDVLKVPVGAEERVVEALKHNPHVEFAEVDALLSPTLIPNDPLFTNPSWSNGYYLKTMHTPLAWDYSTGAGVTIGILDSGFDALPDLAANMVPGVNFVHGTTNTGYDGACDHGAHVAGTAAAVGNNSIGVAGVAWRAKIMPMVIADNTIIYNGSGCYASESGIANAFTYGGDHGIKVMNISYGYIPSGTYDAAIHYAWSKGSMVITSSGNTGDNAGYPADDQLIVVGAYGLNNQITDYSSYGADVDLSAPGTTYTTYSNGSYSIAGGTSFAAPAVAGVAALVWSVRPSLTNVQVRDILTSTADDMGAPGYDIHFGWGGVNAAKAVLTALGITYTDTTPPTMPLGDPKLPAYANKQYTFGAEPVDEYASGKVELYKNGSVIATIALPSYDPLYTWDTTKEPDGTSDTFTIKAYDKAGNVYSTAASSITVDNTPPTLTVTSPTANQIVSGTINLTTSSPTDNLSQWYDLLNIYWSGVVGLNTNCNTTNCATWDTTAVVDGNYTLATQVSDRAGNTTTVNTPVTVKNGTRTGDTIAPTTSITSPAGGSIVGGSVQVSASASDNIGVSKVELYVDGYLKSTVTASPYNFTWDSTSVANGAHTLQTKAYDAAGNVGSSYVVSVTTANVASNDITIPTITITSPANGSKVKGGGSVNVKTTASDASGIASIVISTDGTVVQTCLNTTTCSYSWSSKSVPAGTHTITATATDNSTNRNSNSSFITVVK